MNLTFNLIYYILLFFLNFFISTSITQVSYQFSYTGKVQNVSTPARAYSASIQITGASGGNDGNYQGGRGGVVTATIKTIPGQTLFIYVGGVGGSRSSGISPGGYNGGVRDNNYYLL